MLFCNLWCEMAPLKKRKPCIQTQNRVFPNQFAVYSGTSAQDQVSHLRQSREEVKGFMLTPYHRRIGAYKDQSIFVPTVHTVYLSQSRHVVSQSRIFYLRLYSFRPNSFNFRCDRNILRDSSMAKERRRRSVSDWVSAHAAASHSHIVIGQFYIGH